MRLYNIKSLLNGLKTFINDINNNNITCLKPNCILRIKNDFYDAGTKCRYANDATYVDIKMNMIYGTINDTSDEEECMIIEATKMGPKLSLVIGQSDYLYNIANETYSIDDNYQLYKNKISRNNFYEQSFWKSNIIVSIIITNENMSHYHKIYVLLLSQLQIGACIPNKTFRFFVNCLFHFSLIFLNQSNHSKNVFLNNCFNFNNRKGPLMYGFGINTSFIKSFKSINYQSIEMIMKQTYFNGLPDDNDTTRNKTPMTKINVGITSVKYIFLENTNALIIQNEMYSKILNETKDVIEKFVNLKYANSATKKFKKPTEYIMQDCAKLLGRRKSVFQIYDYFQLCLLFSLLLSTKETGLESVFAYDTNDKLDRTQV